MQKGNDLLDHIDKVKAIAGQFYCLEVLVKNAYIVMILFRNLLVLFEHLITALETMVIKKLNYEISDIMFHVQNIHKEGVNL